MTGEARWAGRNIDKDRLRTAVWDRLVAEGVHVGPPHGNIPNFVGADAAALNLSRLPAWRTARIVKCNPDPPQIAVRLRALYDGKTVYAPVPELTEGFPFVVLDPAVLARKGVTFELAATHQGFMMHGTPIAFEAMERMDLCVVGCVAVSRGGGRTGKGAGFADLELGIFRELGLVDAATPICTTVHSAQLVAEDVLPMEPHDSVLTAIATERGLYTAGAGRPQPKGVDWDAVRPEQFASIPFLAALRDRLERR
ncbi:5-formyltetrahydrofolate cyclo-ligase [Prosthecomicrobium pneumaticum]|uniref:5-formyltetrahydrofolate cyclo-ligase n=1 Tax=Prosthecomicrobium pneumaticum TaxID=81895 RepID=A0A7W9FMP1_9HYPH|nr:5-formyltetrahydrofolate cyclo-ligase [Prosthecomicrobium pneumaticum]MBB5753505.1 5-formyltetrahydrofolate cyclo-ligase [Prosthecomicrobium pneumaticum]